MIHRPSVHALTLLLTLTVSDTGIAMYLPDKPEPSYSKDLLFERLEEFANLDPEKCNDNSVRELYHAYHRPLSDILHKQKSEQKKWRLTQEDEQRFETLSEQMEKRCHAHREKEHDLNKLERRLVPFGVGTIATVGIGVLILEARGMIPAPHMENEYWSACAKLGVLMLTMGVAVTAARVASTLAIQHKGKEAIAWDTRLARHSIADHQANLWGTLVSLSRDLITKRLCTTLKDVCDSRLHTLDNENVEKLTQQYEDCQKLIAKMWAWDDQYKQFMFWDKIQPLEALQKKIVPNFREEDVRRYPLIQTILDSSKATAEQLEKLFTSIKNLRETHRKELRKAGIITAYESSQSPWDKED